MDNENQFRLTLPHPFSFSECLWFLNRNYDDILYHVKKDELIKAYTIDQKFFLFSIKANAQYLLIEILLGDASQSNKSIIAAYVSEWFDLDKDLLPFYALLKKDKRLQYMCEAFNGLRLIGINDLYEALCWSIIGQQINLTFAYSLKRRLVEKYGSTLVYDGETHYLFPLSEMLASASVEDLKAMQFSNNKAGYVIGVAKAFVNKELSKQILLEKAGLAEKIKILTAIRGIGIWTANYTLMKSLREPDCIPHGDAGLLKALMNHDIKK